MIYIFNKIKSLLKNKDNKTIITNVINAFIIKGGAVIISFLTLPAYLNYFGEEKVLGFWFTILSVLTWIFVFDLGIGNGLRNKLVKPLIEKDYQQVKKYITSAYIGMGFLIAVIYIMFLIIYRLIDWNIFFNIPFSKISDETLELAILILFSGIMLQFFLRLINSILFAMQKSALNNFLALLSNLLILIYVSIFTYEELATKLISLTIAYLISVNLPLIVSTIVIFSTTLKESKINIGEFSITHARNVLKLGGLFFGVQILYMLLTTTNEILITWFSGPENVVEYQIYNRIFTLFGTVYTLTLTPVWSMVTKAFSENNYIWIKKLYNVFMFLALIIIILQFALIPFVQLIVNIWLGDETINISIFNSAMFAILASMIVWVGANNSIANGFGELKTQGILFSIGVILKIPIAWILVNYLNSWIGVVVASILALSLYCVVQPIWLRMFLNNKIKQSNN